MARRRRFHRSAPDRGWIVGDNKLTASPDGGYDDQSFFFTLFDFADLDPEALTGRIEQDKSDWFVKRVILNLAVQSRCDGLDDADNRRWVEWSMGTASIENAEAMDTPVPGFAAFGPEAYNLWARQFQSGVLPAYHPGVMYYGVGNPSNEFGIMTVNGNEVPGSGGADPAGSLLMAPYWGPGQKEYDFTVSNAGLRNNQVCGILFTACRGLGPGADWAPNDQLDLRFWYQVLVQKRRT